MQGKNAGEFQKAESQVAFFFFFSFSGITKERLACLPVAVDKRNHKLSKTPFLSFFAEVLMVEVVGTRDDGGV